MRSKRSRRFWVIGSTIVTILAAASPATTVSAQDGAGAELPPDIHPESLTRLAPLTREDMDAEGKAAWDYVVGDGDAPRTGPVPMSLYSPTLARIFSDLNGYLRYNGDLSPRHTEVAILVATYEIKNQYEYSAHEPAVLRFGAPQAVVDTIKYDREPVGLSPEETVIIRLGRQIIREHRLDSELYAEAVELFGEKGLVEMVTVMGDYIMVGMVLTAIDQHLPPERPALLPTD
ncbi:MAG: hypothetical protein PVG24_01290 [Gammaproteobacteria bacterium]|jgi:4-carboxymuconolactone decarboxylase